MLRMLHVFHVLSVLRVLRACHLLQHAPLLACSGGPLVALQGPLTYQRTEQWRSPVEQLAVLSEKPRAAAEPAPPLLTAPIEGTPCWTFQNEAAAEVPPPGQGV